MPTDRNVAEVAALKELFAGSSLIISTDYRGLDVGTMVALRRALKASGVRYRITKNTLARIAADEIGRPEIKEVIDGPCGFLFADSEPAAAAKTLVHHLTVQRPEMGIRGAVLDGEVISEERVRQLASLPPRDQLLAMLLGQMIAPLSGLATVLSGPARGLATVLQRYVEQQGGVPAADDV